jgi:glycosyltransferase involved in cell wall biosynthesis
VIVVSGIWPPDVGGPASHAPEVARFLLGRGHEVEVVTTASAAPAREPYPVRWVSRALPKGAIHLRTAALVWAQARGADVVYATGMFGRSAAGALAARRPYVVKDFQRGGGLVPAALKRARDFELRRAAHVFSPSEYLRQLVLSWGVPPDRVSVLPNPAPDVPELPPREQLQRSFGLNGATLAFAGRLTAQKSLGRALEAVAAADGVRFVIAGEGPDRRSLEGRARELGIADRVSFLGAQPRERIVELFHAADATILSSSWENFPHTVVEALAVGTPVLAMETGGVAEVVQDGVNGLVVPQGDTAALAEAVRRYFTDEDLRERLRAAAVRSVAAYTPERVFGELEATLRRVTAA